MLRKQCEGPLGTYIDGFAVLLAEQGYARRTADERLSIAARLNHWLQRCGLGVGDLNERRVSEFLQIVRSRHYRERRRLFRDRPGAEAALRALLIHLRQIGAIPAREPTIDHGDSARIEQAYTSYLIQERGLSHSTVVDRVVEMRRFLCETFGKKRLALGSLRPQDVVRFISRRAQTVSAVRAKSIASAIRSFCRFLRVRGDITIDLAASVITGPNWRLTALPKFISADDVKLLLQQCDQRTELGQRDYTILLLLARLGLRAGEIAAMTIDDIDWDAGELLVRGKGARLDRLPLPRDVGKALATYLRRGRPRCSTRRLFIRAMAPLRGFNSIAVTCIVERAVDRAGLNPPSRGAHLLRHTLATNLLRRGASLAEIGEILRHRSPDTTRIYAKVDLAALRALAPRWPGSQI